MRELLNNSGERMPQRHLRLAIAGAALASLFSFAVVAVAEDLNSEHSADAFNGRAYDTEMANMRFGFAKRKSPQNTNQASPAARARRINALLPDAGSSFRAHYAFSAEAAAEQLAAAEQKSTDKISELERRARLAITARPAHQRLVRKSGWLGSLGLDRRTVDQRELAAKVDELHVGTARQVDEVESYLGDIEADGFLYTIARASHRLVISAEKSFSQLYNDYVAPKSAYADDVEMDPSGYRANGTRPRLSYEQDGISRF